VELSKFDGQKRDELSMIEVAYAILEQRTDVIDFSDLVNEIQNYLGKSDLEIRETLSQFYTDLNTDGSFISLGENRWGLRSWYAVDEIDEEIAHVEELDEDEVNRPKKKKKRINAFATSEDDDIIDYNDDDPEDDFEPVEDDLSYDDDDDDEEDETVAYDSDLKEIVVDDVDEDADIDEEDDEFSDDEEEDEIKE
jgi:DNA-directed RNA polymerase subunit delta